MIESPPKFMKDNCNLEILNELRLSGLLKSINDEYLYWDKVKYKSKECNPNDLWQSVKMERWLKYSKINFGNYSFNYMITDYIQRFLHVFDLSIGSGLKGEINITDVERNKFLIKSIIEEAISSSQMEGAATTRKKAKEMIQKELRPQNRSENMILNNYNSIQYIIQHKDDDLTPEGLLYIHSLITKNTLDKENEEGAFRSNDEIYVVNHSNSEVVHRPPNNKEINNLINELCIFFNKDNDNFVHPLIKGIIIHFFIAWIHPFSDGNGRTARTLFYWYMLKKGYWLTEYLSVSRIIKDTKVQYEKAYIYTETDDNDLTYFITYHIKTIEKSIDSLKSYIQRKQKETFASTKYLKIPNVNERQAEIIKLLNEDSDRILNIKEIENRFQISNFTARTDLKGLVELGFLEIIQVNKIKQNFIKSQNFNSLLKNYNL